jgi:hypothetical protein
LSCSSLLRVPGALALPVSRKTNGNQKIDNLPKN